MKLRSAEPAAEKIAADHVGESASHYFAEGLRAHRTGQLDIAERCYRGLLALDPDHSVGLHYFGVLALQTGRGRMALELLARSVSLNGAEPEPRYHLALALSGERRFDEAVAHYREAIALKPDYSAAHMNLGNILTEQGRLPEAIESYERVLALDPASAVAHYNTANVLARQGRREEAEERYRAAIARSGTFAEAHNNLGNVLKEQERWQEAESAYARALALRPDYADAHNNIGIVQSARGAFDEALAHFREAVRLNPRLVDAQKNLGLALARSGQSDAALERFRTALTLNPDDLGALHHLARELLAAGAAAEAASILQPWLDRNATAETRSLFALAIQMLPAGELERLRPYVLRALAEGWARGGELERVGISLVKHNGAIATCVARLRDGGGSATHLDTGEMAALAGDVLLRQVMISGRVSDRELERVLTAARRTMLDLVSAEAPAHMLDFFSALARQCFINEYVFAESETERATVRALCDATSARLQAGEGVPAAWPIAIAAYMPLHAVAGADKLAGRAWPDALESVIVQQVREPLEEQAIRASLPALTAIDADSVTVQLQYEENPYPRWVISPPAIRELSVTEFLRARFPLAPFRPVATQGGPDVLIAGCGSGSHAIEAYRRFANARVLAVDLSRASLAYAVRKTRALGLPIEFAQADILRLGDIGRSFDVIEANGSLQCLKDPAKGWRILLSLLRPGGVMMLGLYSRTAREDINAARATVAARGGGSAEEIRRLRQELLALPEGAPGQSVTFAGDFYATSDCRDLLFHVQEYQHTLPEIAAFIAAEGLRFLGFALDPRILRAYAADNPDDPAMIDLDRWHQFEMRNPAAFAAMYQFAVQKP